MKETVTKSKKSTIFDKVPSSNVNKEFKCDEPFNISMHREAVLKTTSELTLSQQEDIIPLSQSTQFNDILNHPQLSNFLSLLGSFLPYLLSCLNPIENQTDHNHVQQQQQHKQHQAEGQVNSGNIFLKKE